MDSFRPHRFAHLHVLSDYSSFRSICRIEDIVAAAARFRMPAAAVTDYYSLAGSVDLFHAARRAGIKAVFGCELSVQLEAGTGRKKRHLLQAPVVLLAETDRGYANLTLVLNQADKPGTPLRPDILARHSRGLICMLGIEDISSKACRKNDIVAGCGVLADIFGRERFFVELRRSGQERERRADESLSSAAEQAGAKPVATANVRFMRKDDARFLRLWSGIDSCKQRRPDHAPVSDADFFASAEEMAARFSDCPEALTAAAEIAERCKAAPPLWNFHWPSPPLPAGRSAAQVLQDMCRAAMMRKFGIQPDSEPRNVLEKEAADRLNAELACAAKNGLSGCFLLLTQLAEHGRLQGADMPPGRGRIAGSLMAFLLGITEPDPLKHGLLFERFFNPDRPRIPDIRFEWPSPVVIKAIEKLSESLGPDRVLPVASYPRVRGMELFARLGAAMNLSARERSAAMKQLLPDRLPEQEQLGGCLRKAGRKKNAAEIAKLWLDAFRTCEGLHGRPSAAQNTVAIGPDELARHLPVSRDPQGNLMCQHMADSVRAQGFLVIHLQPSQPLDIIKKTGTRHRPARQKGKTSADPAGERWFLDQWRHGKVPDIPPLNSPGLTDFLRQAHVETFDDLVAAYAVHELGRNNLAEEYLNMRLGRKKPCYEHPWLQPLLQETAGIVIFAEQFDRIAGIMADIPISRAETMRTALMRRRPDQIESERSAFLEACARNRGVDRTTATALFERLLEAAPRLADKADIISRLLPALRLAQLRIGGAGHSACSAGRQSSPAKQRRGGHSAT